VEISRFRAIGHYPSLIKVFLQKECANILTFTKAVAHSKKLIT